VKIRKSPSPGGRPGISLEDVRLACEQLHLQGRHIGAVNVRLELGRGSYTTIQQHLGTLGHVFALAASRKKN
jgi:hypothetical protein